MLVTVCVVIAVLGVIEGIILSSYFPLGWLTGVGKAAIFLIAMIGIWAIDKWGNQKLTVIEKKQDNMLRGATGEFVLDTKAWRGVVAGDGKGELLLNGQPTDKPYVRQFVGRMMGVREKVLTLAPGMEARHNAVFVFTAAWVEARWGTTGYLNCVTDDQLLSYIAEKNFGKKLTAEEISQIAQAFLGLAHMDKEFGRTPQTV